MVTREGTYDAMIVKEVKKVYSHLKVEDKVVLDIGGNIGASAVLFAQSGAKRVVSVEPDAANYALLVQNTERFPNVEALQAAVVAGDEETITLYLNEAGTNKAIHSTVPHKGRPTVTVQAVNWKALLEEVKPEVVKIDCEGAEYQFLLEPLPDCVKQCVLELHLTKKDTREVEAPRLISYFTGWECVVSPKLEGGNWTTMASYQR